MYSSGISLKMDILFDLSYLYIIFDLINDSIFEQQYSNHLFAHTIYIKFKNMSLKEIVSS